MSAKAKKPRLSVAQAASATALPWLKLYTDIASNTKVRLLSREDRWHFVVLLCERARGVIASDATPELLRRRLALALEVELVELEAIAERLAEVQLIDKNTFAPLGWDSRQARRAPDITAAERQRALRERRKGEAAHGASRDGLRYITAGHACREDKEEDSDKDKESELDERELSSAAGGKALTPRPPSTRLSEGWTVPGDWRAWAENNDRFNDLGLDSDNEADKFVDHHLSEGTTKVDWFAAWRKWINDAR